MLLITKTTDSDSIGACNLYRKAESNSWLPSSNLARNISRNSLVPACWDRSREQNSRDPLSLFSPHHLCKECSWILQWLRTLRCGNRRLTSEGHNKLSSRTCRIFTVIACVLVRSCPTYHSTGDPLTTVYHIYHQQKLSKTWPRTSSGAAGPEHFAAGHFRNHADQIMVNDVSDSEWLLGRWRSCSHGMPWFTRDTEVR